MRSVCGKQGPHNDAGAVPSVPATDDLGAAGAGSVASAVQRHGGQLLKQHQAPTGCHGLISALTDACRAPVVARFLESLPSPRFSGSFSLPSIHSTGPDAASEQGGLSEEGGAASSSAAPQHTRLSGLTPHMGREDDTDSAVSDEAESQLRLAPTPGHRPDQTSHLHRPQQLQAGAGWPHRKVAHAPRSPVSHVSLVTRSFAPLTHAALCAAAAAAAGSAAAAAPMAADGHAMACSGCACPAGGDGGAAAAAGSSGASTVAKRGVFVGNLPSTVSERQLVQIFAKCGKVLSCWVCKDARNQASLGYGYVVYDAAADADAHWRAQHTLDGAWVLDQPIIVRQSTRTF